MLINTEQMISMSEANQNFSKVARMVDQEGQAIILKNNVPRYLVMTRTSSACCGIIRYAAASYYLTNSFTFAFLPTRSLR